MQKFSPASIVLWLMMGSIPVCFAQGGADIRLFGLSIEGNRQADSGLIIATSGLVVGDALSGEKIQRAIRQLWDLEVFSDIKIIAEKVTADGAYLKIQVREYPRLEMVDIGGGKKIGKEELEKAIDLYRGQVVKPSDPSRIIRKIRDLCREKGYLLADITVELREGSVDDLRVLYVRVASGTKVKIKAIELVGNSAFGDKKLRKRLKNTHQKSFFRSGEFHQDKFEEDLEGLVEFYRERGYPYVQANADPVAYSADRRWMTVSATVTEGELYYFGDITFSGEILFSENLLRQQLMFQSAEPYNKRKLDLTLQERLGSLYYDRGYIYANIQASEFPRGGDTLDVNFDIQPGNQFSIRKIHVTGNTKTREKVIRREFSLKPGDTFDVSRLRRSMRDVMILNYFADVRPDVEDVSESEVDLWVQVEEKATDQANLSAGYSERDGLIGAIGFTAPNLFGTGQRLSLDWNFGTRYGSFTLSYTEPWFRDTETLVGGSFYNVRRRWVDGFSERLNGGSVRLGRRFRWPDDYFRGDWIYKIEHAKYSEFSESFRERNERGIAEGVPRVSSSLTQIITRDSRDMPEFPTTGSVTTLTTELAGGPLFGDDRYHKHVFSTEWYSPLASKFVLYSQFQYGFLAGLTADADDIPLLEYFYMGGSGLSLGTPLRGYDERTVGPAARGGGSALGGKSQLKAAIELRLQLVPNPTIYWLGFAEAGNTWLNFDQTDPFDMQRSVGLGVRLYMPLIGLIGLDYGYGLDYYDSAGRRRGQWKPHFQFGRQF